MDQHQSTTDRSRVVIKIGTSSLIAGERLAVGTMARVVEICSSLRQRGFDVILVSSGAIGVGCKTIGTAAEPEEIAMKQATAAVGQIRLMRMWGDLFASASIVCGQVLLTYDNLGELIQHKSARDTFESLLKVKAIPIVNENDTVATFETRQRFGNNDRMAALVSTLVEADWLFLLSHDVDGIYDADPTEVPTATRIRVVSDVDELVEQLQLGDNTTTTNTTTNTSVAHHGNVTAASTATSGIRPGAAADVFSSGGIAAKVSAARIASASGCRTVILSAQRPDGILKHCTERAAGLKGHPDATLDGMGSGVGSLVLPKGNVYTERQRWIVGLQPEGEIVTTLQGAQRLADKKPLLAGDIIEARGDFTENSCVSVHCRMSEQDIAGAREDLLVASSSSSSNGGSGLLTPVLGPLRHLRSTSPPSLSNRSTPVSHSRLHNSTAGYSVEGAATTNALTVSAAGDDVSSVSGNETREVNIAVAVVNLPSEAFNEMIHSSDVVEGAGGESGAAAADVGTHSAHSAKSDAKKSSFSFSPRYDLHQHAVETKNFVNMFGGPSFSEGDLLRPEKQK